MNSESKNQTMARRLRALAQGWGDPSDVIVLADTAATELDGMRTALRKILDSFGPGSSNRMRLIAHEALREPRK